MTVQSVLFHFILELKDVENWRIRIVLTLVYLDLNIKMFPRMGQGMDNYIQIYKYVWSIFRKHCI